jgi:hypothetical protein
MTLHPEAPESFAMTQLVILRVAAAALCLGCGLMRLQCPCQEAPVEIAPPLITMRPRGETATAVFAGGASGACKACSST